jgi:hypothetical protein
MSENYVYYIFVFLWARSEECWDKFCKQTNKGEVFLYVNWIKTTLTSSDVTDSKFLFRKFRPVSVGRKGRFKVNRWWSLMRLSLCLWTAGWIYVTITWVPRERTSFNVQWFWTAPTMWFVRQRQTSVRYGAWHSDYNKAVCWVKY